MKSPGGKVRLLLLLAGLAVAGGIVAVQFGRTPTPEPGSAASEPPPLPGFTETRFVNVGPDVTFIGSAACAACHPNNHASYARTAHSKALTEVDPATEPPDAAFDHPTSGRSYRVYRQDGRLRHEEVVKAPDGSVAARVDWPVKYVVGSGHYARTYLAEVDGFLHESPVTWYTSKRKWDMSPGYDAPQHWGFERAVGGACMACHAGRSTAGDTVHQVTFHEKAIGCENCHGPGSAHRDFHSTRKHMAGTEDPTIVHPARLSRELAEDVCAACHLGGPAAVPVRGRKPGDFRPGRPLTDYLVHYRFDTPAEQMKVVGHVEQLRQSACYQKSAALTCVTCHDPHRPVAAAESVAFHRGKCVECHTESGCKVPAVERKKTTPADACMTCHMPRGDTEVPHVAFTHHRIGRHGKAAADPDRVPNLVAVGDVGRMSGPDRDRNLGLAYSEAARLPENARYAPAFAERARTHLAAAYAAGVRDGSTVITRAVLHWTAGEPNQAAELAREALATADATPDDRAVGRLLLANVDRQAHDFDSAVDHLEAVTKLRRFADDWRLLGESHINRGDLERAVPALQKALAIRPDRPATHQALAEAYRRLGDRRKADEHEARAKWVGPKKR